MTYNYIIIEDEKGALENLRMALSSYNDFSETGFATNLKDGVALAISQMPHIVFLDVELGAESGFDVLKEIRQFTSEVPLFIMTTGHQKYAKEAVNKDVLYFLDKPIVDAELSIALNKCKKAFLSLQHTLAIKNKEGHFFLNLKEVPYIESKDNAIIIHRNSENITLTGTLKEFETILPQNFIRIHRSYIINKHFVEMLNTSKNKVQLRYNQSGKDQLVALEIGSSSDYLKKVKKAMLLRD